MAAQNRKRNIILAILAVILTILVAWTLWGNTALELNRYTVKSEKLPESFSGYRIAHVSDLHNAQMGRDNENLIAMLRQAEPDMIAITGDLIDSRNTDLAVAVGFAEQAMKIAPCYYVSGNHEARVAEYAALKTQLTELGVVILENQRIELQRNGEHIALLGVEDPSFQVDYLTGDAESVISAQLQTLTQEDAYTVLLSHRPELFAVYARHGIDLALCGHAHGGQIRLPFVGGLVAPNQGIFPKYDAGLYTSDAANMIVSRGIGNSLFPIRFNNRPEVILIELVRK